MTSKTRDKPARGGQEKYPWDRWLKGATLRYGLDYHVTTSCLKSLIYAAARRRGLVVSTRVMEYVEGPTRVVILPRKKEGGKPR